MSWDLGSAIAIAIILAAIYGGAFLARLAGARASGELPKIEVDALKTDIRKVAIPGTTIAAFIAGFVALVLVMTVRHMDASGEPAPAAFPKIAIDLTSVNAEGLRGPATGLRAVHYEYCIPSGERYAAEVRGIDATTRFQRSSRGRIGCSGDEVLVLGHTHQRGYREVLERLAALPYVSRIQESHFE